MQVKVEAYKCNACGHVWLPRKPGVPVRCGKCKSPYWNVVRRRK